MNLDSIVRPAPGVASRQSGDETVVVLPEQGRYLVLNHTGAQVWQMADGRRSLKEIAQALAEDWQIETATIEADVLRLATQLLTRGALQESS